MELGGQEGCLNKFLVSFVGWFLFAVSVLKASLLLTNCLNGSAYWKLYIYLSWISGYRHLFDSEVGYDHVNGSRKHLGLLV